MMTCVIRNGADFRRRLFASALSAVLVLCLVVTVSRALTLASSIAEVVIENLAVGKRYSLLTEQKAPLRIRYSGSAGDVLRINVVRPDEGSLKPGYEALPELSWVHLAKRSFAVLEENDRYETDVVVKVPSRKRFRGKRYQFGLRIYVEPGRNNNKPVAVALENRFLISTLP